MIIGIVNWQGVRQHGHFLEYLELFESAVETHNEFRTETCNMPPQAENSLKISLLKEFILRNKIDHIFFPWFHDIQDEWSMVDAAIPKTLTYSGLAALSHAYRGSKNYATLISIENSSKVLDGLKTHPRAIGCLTWDPLVIKKNEGRKFFSLLPDFQDLNLGTVPSEVQSMLENESLKLGLMGQLFSYRGFSYLISLAIRNPRVKFYAIGKRHLVFSGFRRHYEQLLWKIMQLLPNVFIYDNYIDEGRNLNSIIASMDVVLLDTRNYPASSGIVIRSRGLGVPVFLSNWDSALFDLLKGDSGLHMLRPWGSVTKVHISRGHFQTPSALEFKESVLNFFSKLEVLHSEETSENC
jgi:hypothetical protein